MKRRPGLSPTLGNKRTTLGLPKATRLSGPKSLPKPTYPRTLRLEVPA